MKSVFLGKIFSESVFQSKKGLAEPYASNNDNFNPPPTPWVMECLESSKLKETLE